MKNKLELLRKNKGLSQQQMGEIFGVSRQTINAIENGKYCPSLPLSFKIARYFGILIEEVFEYEEEK